MRKWWQAMAGVLAALLLVSCSPTPEYVETAASTVRICPAPKKADISESFTCLVNDQPLALYASGDHAFGILRLMDTAKVQLECDFAVNSATVYPLSEEIAAVHSGNTVMFEVSKYGQYIVELNEEICVSLFVDKDIAVQAKESDIYFKQGINNSSVALDKGNLHLTGDTTYVLQYGAVLDGSLVGENVSNVTITGGGIITGDVNLTHCDNITLKGVTVLGEMNMVYTENTTVSDVKVLSETSALTLSSCSDIEVADSFLHSQGDSLAVKNIPDTDGDLESAVTKNITVRNCTVDTVGGNSLQVGHETVGDTMQSIAFEDITLTRNIGGVAMTVYNANNSDISKVRFSDITVEKAQPAEDHKLLLEVRNFFSFDHSNTYGVTEIGSIEDVDFYDITLVSGTPDIGLTLSGFRENRAGLQPAIHKVSDVTFKNCTLFDTLLTRSYYYMDMGNYTELVTFE